MARVSGRKHKKHGPPSDIFSPRALKKAGLVHRPAQARFAKAIENALKYKENVRPIEAPTGMGKTLGYLAPVLAHAAKGNRVMISTTTKHLQAQLFQDLPLARRLCPEAGNVSMTAIRGAENHICPAAAKEMLKSDPDLLNKVLAAETFDALDLPAREKRRLRDYLSAEPDCPRINECGKDCPWVAMKDAASNADVVVVNHFLALTVMRNGSQPLGKFDAVVVDEGHNIYDVAKVVYGARLSVSTITYLFKRARRHLPDAEGLLEATRKDVSRLIGMAAKTGKTQGFFRSPRNHGIWNRDVLPIEFRDVLARMEKRMKKVASALKNRSAAESILLAKIRRTKRSLSRFVSGEGGRAHSFILDDVADDEKLVLVEHPFSVGGLLQQRFWGKFTSAILTSGTLTHHVISMATGYQNDLPRIRERPDVPPSPRVDRYLAAESAPAFDYKNPDPWLRFASRVVADRVSHLKGGVLVLVPSWSHVSRMRELIGETLPVWRKMVNARRGDAMAAMEDFRDTEGRGLMITVPQAGGEGIDMPEDTLRHVVIARMPFNRSEGSSRADYREMHGKARNTLLQSIGRIARKEGDTGTWWLLDSRIRTSYQGFLDEIEDYHPSRRRFSVLGDGNVVEEKSQ